jgi:nucleotide-binding universal stress UspA family protein
VARGDPAGEIVRAAKEQEQDVPVIRISSHGKGCLRDFLSGNMVQDVVMNSARPVIVIGSGE